MAPETIAEIGERHEVVGRVARHLGVGVETLRTWVTQAEIDGGRRTGVPTEQQRPLDALELATRSRQAAPRGIGAPRRPGQPVARPALHRPSSGGRHLPVGRLERRSLDDAPAESVNKLDKAEVIRRHGPWRAAAVAGATAARVVWWNARRLHGALGHFPPAEYEQRLGPPTAAAYPPAGNRR
jgi:hypothetical protein